MFLYAILGRNSENSFEERNNILRFKELNELMGELSENAAEYQPLLATLQMDQTALPHMRLRLALSTFNHIQDQFYWTQSFHADSSKLSFFVETQIKILRRLRFKFWKNDKQKLK